ncbi:SSI family serine proteinase inhibitor [Saccharothrix deserti]|uniref:SSI family serine proteinase inhibitor n=1 Tax=Saccharothrix deserti TaxID=2593674 RepID=UPI00131D284C|nr:SSI family serine proteinase inhibitor [Saccharothrix deserti]
MAPLPLLTAIAALVPAFSAPESSFVLSVLNSDSLRLVNLTCEPTGGLHPRADMACLALSGVDGQIGGLATGSGICTLEYDPVTVKASGTWRGETRSFEAEFPNRCVMRAETGPVFDF